LQWGASSGATSYDVYLGTSSTPPLAGNTAATSYPAAALGDGTTYYWRVVARNSAGSTSSPTWSFTTAVPAPGAPGLTLPANGASGIALSTLLQWTAATGATSYDVYLGATTSPPLAGNVTGTSYTPAALAPGTAFYWRVVAKNAGGTASSPTWSFSTLAAGSSAPLAVSVTPASGTGARQVFQFLMRDPDGANDLWYARVQFGDPAVTSNACFIHFAPAANLVYLQNDVANGWYGMYLGSGTTSNNQCTLHGATSSMVKSGTDITLTLDITFRPAYNGLRNVNLFVSDKQANETGWRQLGSYTAAADPSPIDIVSLTPNSGSGAERVFTVTYRDTGGAGNIAWGLMSIHANLNAVSGCYIHYDRASNLFLLMNDAASGWLALVPGSTATVQNSQCILRGAGTGRSLSGTDLIVSYDLQFKPGYAGAKEINVQMANQQGKDKPWTRMGTWTVP
jgi:hypothetical protein